MIEAVLFDGDQTLWDFERVMRDALMATAAELRAARPGPFADALSWEDLQADRADVAAAHPDVWSLAELRVRGFVRTLQRRRDTEGGDEDADEAAGRALSASYFAHRDRDPALFPDTVPGLDALRADYRLGLLSNGSRLPETVGPARLLRDGRLRAGPPCGQAGQGDLRGGGARARPSGPRRASSWATTRSTTWPVRTAPVGGLCGSTATATVPFPEDGPRPDAVVATLTELPDVLRRLRG